MEFVVQCLVINRMEQLVLLWMRQKILLRTLFLVNVRQVSVCKQMCVRACISGIQIVTNLVYQDNLVRTVVRQKVAV